MRIDRRTMMAGVPRRLLAAAPALAQRREARSWLVRPGDHHRRARRGRRSLCAGRAASRSSDRAWAEMVATGVTVLRDTVMPVGNVADPWGDYQKDVGAQAEHPQRQPRPAAAGPHRRRHPEGQAREEVRGGPRHAGHVDGRAGARPAGAAEEGRGDVRPADLQQPQPRRRRRARAGQCRPVASSAGRRSSGSRRRSCCSTSATAARGRWPRRRPTPSGRW